MFDGDSYDPIQDKSRLKRQLEIVRQILSDGKPHTLYEISEKTGYPVQSISARIRDLRKPKFGGYDIPKRSIPEKRGTWEYWMQIRKEEQIRFSF